MLEKIVGRGENAGNQHFSPFPTMFSKAGFLAHRASAIDQCPASFRPPSVREQILKQS